MIMKKWYACPVQVAFCDVDNSEEDDIHYIRGIAYQDKVICGCCGGVIDIEELFDYAAVYLPEGTPVIIEDGCWADITREIMPKV